MVEGQDRVDLSQGQVAAGPPAWLVPGRRNRVFLAHRLLHQQVEDLPQHQVVDDLSEPGRSEDLMIGNGEGRADFVDVAKEARGATQAVRADRARDRATQGLAGPWGSLGREGRSRLSRYEDGAAGTFLASKISRCRAFSAGFADHPNAV